MEIHTNRSDWWSGVDLWNQAFLEFRHYDIAIDAIPDM